MSVARSLVEYFGLGNGHSCGYCGNSDTNISHGLWAHYMSCQDYEDLMNRGWRRSGKYVYKPLMNVICCPMYTIRCEATNIKLSKSQKKVLKRMYNFLLHGRNATSSLQGDNMASSKSTNEGTFAKCDTNRSKKKTSDSRIEDEKQPKEISGKKRQKVPKQPEKAECPTTRNAVETTERDGCKTLEDYITKLDYNSEMKHKLEVKLCRVHVMDDDEDCHFKESFSLFCKYQKAVHKDPNEKLTKRRIKTVRSHPESNEFTKYLASEFQLFQKYQIEIHNEKESEISISEFKRFLVHSPLVEEAETPGLPSMGLGSFHQQYFLDDKLIAVGVIDILPHCISSKYFFYDPAYSFLSLGTYSALWEIYFVRRLQEECANLRYYYMGYYIHSCHKMRYKGSYDPSFLLCPENYTFQPIKTCLEKLDKSKYSRLAAEDESCDDEAAAQINDALILHKGKAMSFQIYAEAFLSEEEHRQKATKKVLEYCQLVGRISGKMLLYGT